MQMTLPLIYIQENDKTGRIKKYNQFKRKPETGKFF